MQLFEARWAKVLFLMFTWAGIMCGLFGSVGYAVLSFYDRAGRVDEALPLTFQNVTGVRHIFFSSPTLGFLAHGVARLLRSGVALGLLRRFVQSLNTKAGKLALINSDHPVDITITACLGIQLSKKLGSVNSMTNSILLRLISVAVESASYTSVVALMGGQKAFW